MSKYVVPMYESERGWGGKIDGYAGPFETLVEAKDFKLQFNMKHNNEPTTPDYYIAAMEPVAYTNQKIDYRSTL